MPGLIIYYKRSTGRNKSYVYEFGYVNIMFSLHVSKMPGAGREIYG